MVMLILYQLIESDDPNQCVDYYERFRATTEMGRRMGYPSTTPGGR